MRNRIVFSYNKKYSARYDDKTKELLVYCSDNLIETVTSVIEKNVDEVAKNIFDEMNEKDFGGDCVNSNYHEQLISNYKQGLSNSDYDLKVLLFLLSKMSSVNKKIYRVNNIIGEIKDLGVIIDKDFNPFENEVKT